MKHEIKVEFSNKEELVKIIEKSYFTDGNMGKIGGNKNSIKIDDSVDEVCYSVFKGLNNTSVKIINGEVIDGSMRFLIEDNDGDVSIYPISIYCVKENDKYTFY